MTPAAFALTGVAVSALLCRSGRVDVRCFAGFGAASNDAKPLADLAGGLPRRRVNRLRLPGIASPIAALPIDVSRLAARSRRS